MWTLTMRVHNLSKGITVGRFLIAWFKNCILDKSGQIAIAMVDHVL